MKKYKEAPPSDTVNKIRNILFELGIMTQETNISNGVFYSCRINLANDKLDVLNFGTNGKGSTYEYALASGYAEFMERLQNHMLFKKREHAVRGFVEQLPQDSIFVKTLEERNLVCDFIYDNLEEIHDVKSTIEYCYNELSKMLFTDDKEELFQILNKEMGFENLILIPFYSVSYNEEKKIPLDLMLMTTGSNGMSAGNTYEEAVLQGICEIFERYAASEIFNKELTPPTIPNDFFIDKPVYKTLKYLEEETNYKVIIKDCSLGKELPVLGVIIIDQEKQLYNFKLGADFLIDIALERCLNEVHQGTVDFHGLSFKLFDSHEGDGVFSPEDYTFHNYKKIFVDGSGIWPASIFFSENSYDFKGVNANFGLSDKEDLKYCIELTHKLGYEVLIRNVSHLGFPAYYVIIPGMSQLATKKSDYNLYKKSINGTSLLKKIKSLNNKEIRILIDGYEDNYHVMKCDGYKYFNSYLYNVDKDLLDLDIELLLFMLYYKIGEPLKAKQYLDIFLTEKNRIEYSYFFAISDYILFKDKRGYSQKNINDILSKVYGEEVAEEIVNDLSSPEDIFQYHDFPNCYNCEECSVVKSCRFFDLLDIEKKVHDKIQCANINQLDQSKYYDFFKN
jgi:ribosomal protein S12 methylthiotransferase accessory factor